MYGGGRGTEKVKEKKETRNIQIDKTKRLHERKTEHRKKDGVRKINKET
jgi:hypothetical protein